MVGEEKFRRLMGHFPTGVTVVTARDLNDRPVGLTVSAFTSVSLDPPLVLVCIHHEAEPHDPLLQVGYFGVNVLSHDQGGLAIAFSQGDSAGRFQGLETLDAPMGSPLLPGSLAWLECRVHQVHEGGDHSIIVGEVLECELLGGDPLLFFRRELKGFGPSRDA